MDQMQYNPMLDMLDRPAFLVKDFEIVQVNHGAKQKMFSVGEKIYPYLGDFLPIYRNYTGGCLYLNLTMYPFDCGAAVTQVGDLHLFCLEQQNQADQALAVIAQQLRMPLHTLFSIADTCRDAEVLQRGLSQIHRIVTNMADFPRYRDEGGLQLEPTELCSFFAETMDKATTLLSPTGLKLRYTALPQCVYGLADAQLLERAVYNLLSNAAKFSPKNGVIDVKLVVNGSQLSFTVQDQGDGIPPEILNSIFVRYLRVPGIEDSRHGVGLGLALVRTIAMIHNGTVLIDQPECGGTRVTMTVAVNNTDAFLRSPVQFPRSDYASGHDRALLELSDVLPAKAYKH